MYVLAADGSKRFISSTAEVAVGADDRLVGIASGGGGYGNPLERDVELVRSEVRDGFISRDAAARFYGVVVRQGSDPPIDERATSALREALAAVERPQIDPMVPNASTWLAENIGERDQYLVNPRLIEAAR
jgi:N-methylhydantoinase B